MDTSAYGFETLHIDPDSLNAGFTARNGELIRCRLIRPDDAHLLIDLFSHLSPESRRRRFNLPLENIDSARIEEEAQRLANVDNRTVGGAVLALSGPEEAAQLIGVARLGRYPNQPASQEAETALVVRDDFQGQGVGSALLALLAILARRMAVHTLTASVQADNDALFALLRGFHLPFERHTTRGETTISLAVADIPTPKNPRL